MNRRRSAYRKLLWTRRSVQVLVILFFLTLPVLNRMGIRWVLGSLYALTAGPIRMADPLMAFQSILLTGTGTGILLLACVIPIGLALIFGKVFCSWVCPYNTFLEWLEMILERPFRQRRLARRWRKAVNPHPTGYWGVFGGLLAVMVVSGTPVMSFLSMPGLLSTQMVQTVGGTGPGLELALVGVLLAGEAALLRRTWCRSLCPVGAFLGIFRTPVTLQVRYDETICGCSGIRSPCITACPLVLSPRESHLYPACFQCGLCLEACSTTGYGALTFEWSRRSTLQARSGRRE